MEIKDPKEKETLSAKIRSVADGRVVLGTDAVTYGLIDEVGDSKSALALLQKIAAEEFEISDPESLELDDAYGKTSIWDELLQSNLSGIKRQLTPDFGLSKADLLPKSLRYTNQPLWLMESLE
jgi:ClpP class serine protease